MSGAPTRVFIARLAGIAVFDPRGDQVGKVRDIVVPDTRRERELEVCSRSSCSMVSISSSGCRDSMTTKAVLDARARNLKLPEPAPVAAAAPAAEAPKKKAAPKKAAAKASDAE